MSIIDPAADPGGATEPLFQPGSLVRHKRYGYRGVVVDYDMCCQADEAWYQSNQTQPDRDQPWYHVLVDNSSTVNYPAQSSLVADTLQKPINHPYIAVFFEGFKNGQYTRNSHPWPQG